MTTTEEMEVYFRDRETGKEEMCSMREVVNYLSCFMKKDIIESELRKGKTLQSPWSDFTLVTLKNSQGE